MLRALIFIILLSTGYDAYASMTGSPASCRTSLQTSLTKVLAREVGSYQNHPPQDNILKIPLLNENSCHVADLQKLQQESLLKVEALEKNPAFQEMVTELQNSVSKRSSAFSNPHKEGNGELYVFISFSMGEKALLNLTDEAKQHGALLVLRGFKGGSYTKAVKALQGIITKTGQGVLIDPELYSLFNITAVPTFVLAKPFTLQAQARIQTPIKWAPIHDKLQGHVSLRYALEQFAAEGDLKADAQILLEKSLLKRGVLQ